jgi:hypothetical protein
MFDRPLSKVVVVHRVLDVIHDNWFAKNDGGVDIRECDRGFERLRNAIRTAAETSGIRLHLSNV